MPKRIARRRPPKTQSRRPRKKREEPSNAYWDVTHRPLQCLVFLLPMVLAYEIGMAVTYGDVPLNQRSGLAAAQLLRWFFSLFGATGAYLPGAVLIAVLLVWHIASHHPWKVSGQPLVGMAGESILLAIPLLFLHKWIPGLRALAGGSVRHDSALNELLLSIGAGIYEELVFRLIAISVLTLLLIDTLGMKQVAGVALAVIISSLLFGFHHYPPIGDDMWSTSEFAFRTAAGAYLAAVFVLRGFGLAVGCHVIYDVIAFWQLV
ncbi:MAG: CPBP family intramembrane metalloprotease [Phycisphaerales bacterium]|nr:CPBP family intramembrane metalloprotease [Phycisphaerales bacterium]